MPLVLTFGDSNTHGSMPIDDMEVRQRHGADTRWPQIALGDLGADWTLIEEGLPGRTTCHPDDEMGPHMDGRVGLFIALESHGPIDFMTLMLGTNDLKEKFGRTPQQIAADAGTLLEIALSDEMQDRHGGFEILLICPPPILEQGVIADMFSGGRLKSLELAKHYGTLADMQGVGLLNAGDIVESSPVDGIHFSADMHQKLGRAVAARLNQMAATAE